MPAYFIAFDVLQLDGQELLHVPYGERRTLLEQLFTDRGLSAPWTLCPETTDVATAQDWLTSWTKVPGVEGLVIRGSGQRYLRGVRALYKVRRRDTTASWGSRGPLDFVLVEPELVAEVMVDTARERGSWRHPVRFARIRLDVAGRPPQRSWLSGRSGPGLGRWGWQVGHAWVRPPASSSRAEFVGTTTRLGAAARAGQVR
ncbi:hypothetical protein H3146_04040 [Streptomyces sp. OF3]|uniref:ATP-dependent DNA ligase family profile domain-containing protein n=2 Tax=Streptomyces alkaliterrae TaxID=2213162 RepID=A0A7W3WHN1_9ACTN|nr:hypothetical protein [Streptomyces alkaliterrae]